MSNSIIIIFLIINIINNYIISEQENFCIFTFGCEKAFFFIFKHFATKGKYLYQIVKNGNL